MVSIVLLSAVILMGIYMAYKYMFYKTNNFPPGPPRIPVFGSYLFLLMMNPKYLHKGAMLLSKLYKSSVIGFYIGKFPTVVANHSDAIKEILYRQEFDGRPNIFLSHLRDPNFNRRGIFFTDGHVWKDQRRFILRHLRDFGFGRRFDQLESVINDELYDMIDLLRNGPKYPHEIELVKDGQALCPLFMGGFIVNCFFKILIDERIPRNEQESLINLGKNGMIFQRSGDDYGKLLSIIPWIGKIFPELSKYKPLRESSLEIYNFIKTMIDRNYETFDENDERNFLDIYFKEMKKDENNDTKHTTFLYDQLILSIVDFMFPALTAVSTQIAFLFQWFLIKPELLKNIQKEIAEVVGISRLPTLDDRKNLSYTEATIREVLRVETLVPSSIIHRAIVDTELMGFTIPKDTLLVPSLFALHGEKGIWNDPENFRPERFLDEKGVLSLKKDISLPFGAGKRLCAGETFARNMLFLVVSAICQNFNITLRPGESPPDMNKTLNGIIITPPDYWLNYTPR